ncbi:protein PIN-LIKES 2-like [Chenopodium quinoa]|uniref:protein PIN-LIKES 2-like n=1 Tax=Chenopodium quinoa TaxID=63459 RepID=UPI000B77F55B|nr:protein PIN-LIKES 2-like [Chenopodium quinoa]
MAESLFSLVYQEKMKNESLYSAIIPLLKLISLTLIGVLLAHPKAKLVPRATFKLLSKLVFGLFLPCLIFTNLGQSITFKNFTLWWFIPLNVVLSIVIGSFLGYLVTIICRPPPEYVRFTVIMTALGNMGNLPLAIITSVCHSKNHPFGKDCEKNGVAYASFAQWVAVALVYTFVYHMMEPPLEYYEVVEESDFEDEIQDKEYDMIIRDDNELSMPLLHDAEWPGIKDKEIDYSKTPFVARVFNSLLFDSLRSLPELGTLEEGQEYDDPKSRRCFPEPKMVRKIRIVAEQTPIKHILSPPIIASFLAIIIGMVPELKGFVFGEDAPLSFITDSFQFMANAMMPSAMLVLGGMLAEGPEESRLGIKTTVGIIVARLLVLPLAGIGVLVLADKLGLLVEGDQMYRFVILLHYVTPSAILLGAIASLRGFAVQEASALLFWQHVLAVVSISVYIFVFFKFLLMSSLT